MTLTADLLVTVMHVLFSGLWIYFTAVFGTAFWFVASVRTS
jgi:hypothetical protein